MGTKVLDVFYLQKCCKLAPNRFTVIHSGLRQRDLYTLLRAVAIRFRLFGTQTQSVYYVVNSVCVGV
jgi:hypothetical protein